MVSVLFLCLGNICRSPMAEAVFRKQVEDAGLQDRIEIDSAGLGGWHAGERPHRGTLAVLDEHSVAHAGIHSRQITQQDVAAFDYIVAMDAENMEGLKRYGALAGNRVFRLLDLVEAQSEKNVPDPYYTGNFDEVYEMVTDGCQILLEKIRREHEL
ncbi:low molecular weight protein-tyrosine-phosphatase [Tumebacillus lipolyticus]|uniref:protein-tyrosine-phosphatase n=1 Tax=Tumebacillus lipolyticus TaxID=1280370 RepID=A0ABW4ZWN6_9BACL